MAFQRKTMRRMPPVTRNLCKRLNAIELELKRIKRLIPDIESMERESIAFMRASKAQAGRKPKIGYETDDGDVLIDGEVNIVLRKGDNKNAEDATGNGAPAGLPDQAVRDALHGPDFCGESHGRGD